jgi:hypothetical protein
METLLPGLRPFAASMTLTALSQMPNVLRIPRERDPQQPRPIFNIEAGAFVNVTVGHRVQDDTSPRDITPHDNKEQTEVIDVTPESIESD